MTHNIASVLANAVAAFYGYENYILQKYLNFFCYAYMNDIVFCSGICNEHMAQKRQVLGLLEAGSLLQKLSKCQSYTKRIGFAWFFITLVNAKIKPDRICTIAEWPIPKSHFIIKVLVGFAHFYHCFILNLSKIAQPRTNMLKGGKNDKFTIVFWLTSKILALSMQLLEAFTRGLVLIHIDAARPMCLKTDSSGFGIASSIIQLAETGRGLASESPEPRDTKAYSPY